MPRRLLVVVTTEVADGALRDLVRSHAGDDAEILVVAPASDISRLDWLTNAEDDARAEAASLAAKTAEATPTTNVEASVGASDPVKAIEDALRTFPADEIVVVTHPDDQAGWLEKGTGETAQVRFRRPVTRVTVADELSRFGLPVRRLAVAREGGDGEPAEGIAREVAEGKTARIPLLLLGSVAATVWAFAALIAGIVLLLLWWLL